MAFDHTPYQAEDLSSGTTKTWMRSPSPSAFPSWRPISIWPKEKNATGFGAGSRKVFGNRSFPRCGLLRFSCRNAIRPFGRNTQRAGEPEPSSIFRDHVSLAFAHRSIIRES